VSAYKLIIITACSALFIYSTSFAEPINLSTVKTEVKRYHDSGQYTYDFTQATQSAQRYLEKRIVENNQATDKKKLAIVLDIDETALSNYSDLLARDFSCNKKMAYAQIQEAHDPAMPSILTLYNYAESHQVAVFFITGRPQILLSATKKNLQDVGYTQWAGLFLRPDNNNTYSVIPFKSAMRKKITEQGYDIVLSIGDQYSDLAGGYDDKMFKVPNPYYYIP
jgi:predicted secreted acid phosphatase